MGPLRSDLAAIWSYHFLPFQKWEGGFDQHVLNRSNSWVLIGVLFNEKKECYVGFLKTGLQILKPGRNRIYITEIST